MPDAVASLPDYEPKLWLWSADLHGQIGERFAAIDLDVVLLADVAPLLDTQDPIVIWDEAVGEPFNTSLMAIEPGAGNEVWDDLTPERLRRARHSATRWTGDQSWVAHVLCNNRTVPKTFGERDGVLRYRAGIHRQGVPASTKAVFFCGPIDPSTEREHSNWVRQNWR